MHNNIQKIEISHRTILFTLLLLAGAWLLFAIKDLILLFFVALIIMAALNPVVSKIEKYIPRWLSILIVYLLIFASFVFITYGIVPSLISQSRELVNVLPKYFENLKLYGITPQSISTQFQILENLPSEIAKMVVSIFSNIIILFVVFVVAFYLLLEHKNASRYSFFLFGEKGKIKALQFIELWESRLGSWIGAQIILMFIVGGLSFLGFSILGLRYAVALALLAGVLEVIPNIGPTISAVFATLAGLTISPFTGLAALVWGLIVQQLENNVIVPKLMKEAVGLNPLATIFFLAVGFRLAGVVGALLAIPVYLTIEVALTIFFTESFPTQKPLLTKKTLKKE